MAFSIVLAALALIALAVIFVAAALIKGLKVAFIATGSALILFVILYVVIIFVITRAM